MKKLAQKLQSSFVENMKENKARWIVTSLCLIVIVILLFQLEIKFKTEAQQIETAEIDTSVKNPMQDSDDLPNEADFKQVAETNTLRLKFDDRSGHFIVEDKRNENVWHSYPNPEHWEDETIPGIWRQHLRSPIMIQTLDFQKHNSRPKISNWISDNGTIEDIEEIEGGVRLVYDLTNSLVKIPVEITIKDDYLQTRIVDEGIEEAQFGLLWARLFPFIGAEHSKGQNGYLFVPDGSGAIISFNEVRKNQNKHYSEPVYGTDEAFNTGERSSRYNVQMPVFGIKSDDKSFIAVIETGEEYANVYASPAGVYSQYNWVTAEFRYRTPFRQITNRSKDRGFITYDKENRYHNDRTIRYYFLDTDQTTYAGMASRYRQYLMEEKGFNRIESPDSQLPLQLTIIGGDQEEGLFTSKFLKTTTTSQAMEIVKKLHGLGIHNMNINMVGFQKNGFNEFGRILPIDRRLGGNDGMKSFIDLAHSLDFPVSFGVNFFLNGSGANGFSERHHGMRDLAGTILKYRDWADNSLTAVSHNYLDKFYDKTLQQIKDLGFDGITFGGGYDYAGDIGNMLFSDFNDKFGGNRTSAIAKQQELYAKARDTFDIVNGTRTFQYVNSHVDHIFGMEDDYSYDLFSKKAIPFRQIALHGLVSYTSNFINEREEYRQQFLKDIEFGAVPSFVFTYEPTERLRFSEALRLFSSQYSNWEDEAVEQYQIFNEALGDVQDQFIINHQALANNVFETTYENGKRIIVNYGTRPYVHDGVTIEGLSFEAIGGAQ